MKTLFLRTISVLMLLNLRSAAGTVKINEIMYDPFSGWEEWIEIVNEGSTAQDLQGWTLEDAAGRPRTVSSVRCWLNPGDFLILAPSEGACDRYPWPVPVCEVDQFPRLNNDDDILILRNGQGAALDSVFYQSEWGGGDGVSLERVPHSAAAGPVTWGGSTHLWGATPGEPNSLAGPLTSGNLEMKIDPNPFSPDGDGFHDRTVMTIQIPWRKAALRLLIFNVQGRLLRTLVQGASVGPVSCFEWDGRDNRGSSCPIGVYVVFAEAWGSGEVKRQQRMALVLARRW